MNRTRIRRAGIAAVAAMAATAAIGTGLAASPASASSPSDPVYIWPGYYYNVEAFRQTVKPWETITIPSLSCPTGEYLLDEPLSPGRLVPKGVQVLEPGGVGVTINYAKSVEVVDPWGKTLHPITRTDAARGLSTATNWDPISSHELVINLKCTPTLALASKDPAYG